MRLKKLVAGAMTTAMAMSMMCLPAFAATATYENGDYVGTVHMMNATNTANYSMCDGFFQNDNAQVTVTDEATIIKLNVVSPVTVGSSTGDTLGETKATYGGTEYTAAIDSSYTEPAIEWPNTVAIGSVTAGESRTYQIMTFTLPADAVDALDEGITVAATVNAMGYAPEMLMKITDLAVPSAGDEDNRSMDITADVAAKEASYSVTIPESVAMGTLSTETDTTKDFSVNVIASDLNGTVSVAAAGDGTLKNGTNSLAFTNNFGTKTVNADTAGTDLTGTLTVTKDAVKAAASGNYTGTTTFAISYTAN